MAKKRKRKWIWLRYRRDDPEHNLMVSVQRWIHANGGRALVLGGIELQQWPGQFPSSFKVAISVGGRKPEMAEKH